MEEAPPAQSSQSSSKSMVLFTVVAVLLLVGIGGYMLLGQKKQNQTAKTVAPSPTEASNAFTSIKDALAKSLTLQCDYSEGAEKTVVYMKGGAVRTDATSQKGVITSVIVKDGTMYSWTGKQGIMMKFDMQEMIKEMAKVTPQAPVPSGEQNPGSMMQALEAYKKYCKTAAVADALFVAPTDVKFVDQTQMMKNAQNMMKSVTPGQGISEEDAKKMMQQYQSTPPAK